MAPARIKANAQGQKESQVNRPIRVPERFITRNAISQSNPPDLSLACDIENAKSCPIPGPRGPPFVPSGKFFALPSSMATPPKGRILRFPVVSRRLPQVWISDLGSCEQTQDYREWC